MSTDIRPQTGTQVVNALARFRRLHETQGLTPEVATRLATEAAAAFVDQYTASEHYLGEAVTLLCELASLDDPALSQIGVHGLFPLLVERLGDAFTPEACALYNRLFAQVIQHCRRQPNGVAIDRQLQAFGLGTEADLLLRAAHVRTLRRFDKEQIRSVKKAFVLSRVTLGADVAVTSVVLAALRKVFPTAEIKLLAHAKTLQLFAGDPRVHLRAIEYPRGGALAVRLTSWQRAVEAIQQDTKGLHPTEYVIVDPDSRLTQLGLLPLVADERPYFFFESRSYCVAGLVKLSALTAHWLQQVFGMAEPVYPYCTPSQLDVAIAQRSVDILKTSAKGPIVSVNLGVGANPAKRLPDLFEFRLIARLLSEGATVILDKGGDAEEVARVERLVATLGNEGFRTLALDEGPEAVPLPAEVSSTRLLTWQGGIGRFAAFIAASTAYIGYDSAGQHIAAALGVPTIDIFTGFTSPRMPERWAPQGSGPVHMVVVAAGETLLPARLEAIVDDVLAHVPRG
ncbi:MAG TPA: glycosyltransferase family 9 protein [Candidatus Tectomicrobia bacterium]|nr:glycosyltransferase family 9 protein [Candidatus Tectomicrobia bacterium]